jgi:hypothetical protein
MKLERIEYSDLNAKQKEVFNFQKVAGELADFGFNCIKLADDWQGADFLAYHKDGTNTLKVQLKSRLLIAKKYVGKELFMAFPIRVHWYLIEHERLIEIIGKTTSWLDSPSWQKEGLYSSGNPNSALLEALSPWKL